MRSKTDQTKAMKRLEQRMQLSFRLKKREKLQYKDEDLTDEAIGLWKEIGLPPRLNLDIKATRTPVLPDGEELLFMDAITRRMRRLFTLSIANNVTTRKRHIRIRRWVWPHITKQDGEYNWQPLPCFYLQSHLAHKWHYGISRLLQVTKDNAQKKLGQPVFILRHGTRNGDGEYKYNWFFRVEVYEYGTKIKKEPCYLYSISGYKYGKMTQFMNIKAYLDSPDRLVALQKACEILMNEFNDMCIPTAETEEEKVDENIECEEEESGRQQIESD